jgi:hypothetical protein
VENFITGHFDVDILAIKPDLNATKGVVAASNE